MKAKKKPRKSAIKPVSDDDMALFRDAVGEVREVRHDRVEASKPVRAPIVRRSENDDKSVMAALLDDLSEYDFLETGEHLSYTQPGVQRSVLKKLKSGRYSIQNEIDLHGLTVEEARQDLSAFLKSRARAAPLVRAYHSWEGDAKPQSVHPDSNPLSTCGCNEIGKYSRSALPA